jgi:hypothetical protein
MPINKIFYTDNLTSPINTYLFSIVWAPEGVCSLSTLQGKTGTGGWHQIITHSVADNDGEISVKIGEFRVGIDLTIGFGVDAFTDIKKAAIFVTNKNTGETRKMKPEADATKDITKADPWMDSFTFKTY